MPQEKRAELSQSLNELLELLEKTSDIDQFLADTASMLAARTGAHVSAIYLYDEAKSRLVRATTYTAEQATDPSAEELPQDLAQGEGMIGLAFSEARSLRSTREEAAERHGSKLLVPIRHGPVKVGVFALAHQSDDYFTDSDERFVRTVASHLGGSLENTAILLRLRRQEKAEPPLPDMSEPVVIGGRTVSGGMAHGRAFQLDQSTHLAVREQRDAAESQEDRRRRFDDAVEQTLSQIDELQSQTESRFADIASLIFNSHLLMLRDDTFTGKMRELISEDLTPEDAISTIVQQYASSFEEMEESRFREKAQDVRDLGHRLCENLSSGGRTHGDYSGNIVIAEDAFPSEIVKLALQHVEGIVFHGSAVTAHVAILAGSLGIPVLMSADRRIFSIPEGTELLLGADEGKLYINPSDEKRAEYRETVVQRSSTKAQRDEGGKATRLGQDREGGDSDEPGGESSQTRCGTAVSVLANINLLTDLNTAMDAGADGIGLYRSEFPFIIRNDFVEEDEQHLIYRQITESFPEKEIVLRTVDIGGDKLIGDVTDAERNPFLGVRGIRFSLAHREMFRDQLRAMLRAGVDRDLRILFPMVSTVEEVELGREEIQGVQEELEKRGIPHNTRPKVGAMIELPSAVEAIEEIAEASDFLSIGTNDLVMYLLAVDRTNERLNELYRSYHPAVLRVLRRIAAGVGDHLDELSVCGDSAADPVMLPFLLGIGIRKLSVSPSRIPELRRRIRSYTVAETEEIRDQMLAIKNNREMEAYLEKMRRTTATA